MTPTPREAKRAQKSHNRLLLSFLFNSCRSSLCVCRPATSRVGCSFVPAVMTIFYLFYIFSLCSRFYLFFLRRRRLSCVEFSSVKRVMSSHRYLLFTSNSLHPCCCIEAAAVDLISDFFADVRNFPDFDEKLDGEFGTQYLFSSVKLTNTDWHHNLRLLRNVEILNQDSLEHINC